MLLGALLPGMLLGCGGGASVVPPPTEPPVITAVTPTGAVGAAGTEVTFSAIATGSPTAWEWDFGVGAFPLTSTEASPTVVLLTRGEYQCRVTAITGEVRSAPFTFSIEVSPSTGPRVLEVTPPITGGFVGKMVTLAADATNDPTGWTWNFGDAATPSISHEANPTVKLLTEGIHQCTVIASNADGPSPPKPFEVRVSINPDWQTHVIAPIDDPYFMPGAPSVIVIDGKAMVAVTDFISQEIYFTAANVPNPRRSADKNSYSLARSVVGSPKLVDVAGRPAIYAALPSIDLGLPHDYGTTAAFAAQANPGSAADWTWSIVDAEMRPADSGVFNGRLVIGGEENDRPGWGFRLAIATTDIPAVPQDWMIVEHRFIPGKGMLQIGDRFCMAPHGNFISSATPADPESWDFHQISEPGQYYADYASALRLVNGKPLIVLEFGGRDGWEHRIAIGEIPVPKSWQDWKVSRVPEEVGQWADWDCVVSEGRPLVVYQRWYETEYRLRRSWVAEPSSLVDWQRDVLFTDGAREIAIAAVDGYPAFFAHSGLRNGRTELVITTTEAQW